MRKFLALLLMMAGSPCFALELPNDVGEWHSVSTNIIPLITEYNRESQGRITFRTYKRESPSAILEVILTEGAGTGKLYVPEKVNGSEGIMPCDSGFEVVKVSGHDAIIESQSYMPLALAVNADDNVILNLESSSAGKDELITIAEEILSSWKAIK